MNSLKVSHASADNPCVDRPLTVSTQTSEQEVELEHKEPLGPTRTPQHADQYILYVDDDASAREAFADAASSFGYCVDTAETGGDALTMASQRSYEVIAADLRMPSLNGLALIQLLRPKRPEASYLIVTGASHLDLPEQASGEPLVDEVVSKPWSLSDLAKILKRAVDRSQHRRADSLVQKRNLPILVLSESAEDGTFLRRLIAEALPKNDAHVVKDLSDAVEVSQRRDFQSIIVKIETADSSALEKIAGLRRAAPELPIIAIGNSDDDDREQKVLTAGASDYVIEKKLDSYHLRRSLRLASERKSLEDRLAYLAERDPVTGLANRAALRDELSRAIARVHQRHNRLALLFLDLDRFKNVNESLGHDLGDRLLQVVANRLLENLRDVDIAARLGGDEFAIVLEGLRNEEEAVATAQRLLEALTPPARLQGYEIACTGSIGIAIYPDHGETGAELMQHADRAMYRAKQNGRDGYHLYSNKDGESRSGVLERLQFESSIRHALERDQYVVFFQPQLTLDRKQLVGMEALVRWQHPELGLVLPGRFMPFLESSGLIKGVGEWVLRTACRQVKEWQDYMFPHLRLSVNLSARQFEGSDLVVSVERALAESGLPATHLELEITESLLMKDTERTRSTLLELKALGVRIAIDDFGTGYSSLAYLTTFPLDCLKIDRSFVHDITTNEDDRTVADAIIGLGHSLRLDVMAEGVETQEQLELLKGCDGFQGFLVSRPEPPKTARAFIEQYRNPESASLAP